MPSALVLLAPGAEEMETTIVVDVLRRAKVDVLVAGVEGDDPVECSRGVRITPDIALADVSALCDVVVLPGGAGGAEVLSDSPAVGELLHRYWDGQRVVAAICAAPTALLAHGVALGSHLTSHPSVRELLRDEYEVSDDRVVEDGRLVTSQGPGTSFEFALALVARLCGSDVARQVRGPMVLA
jgi:protein DJ-1